MPYLFTCAVAGSLPLY